jgi:cytochrome c553
MKRASIVCIATLLLTGSALMAWAGGNLERGKEKATQVCAACHTVEGISQNPIFPHIGGQYQDYMLHALRSYKSGERQNGIMQGIVSTLTEQDMEDVSTYYAAQPGALASSPH